jgi:hypothetical protein
MAAGRNRTTERLVGAVFVSALLLNPPILGLFGVERTLLGIPVLYLYVFAAWAAVILMIAAGARRLARSARSGPGGPAGPAGRDDMPER